MDIYQQPRGSLVSQRGDDPSSNRGPGHYVSVCTRFPCILVVLIPFITQVLNDCQKVRTSCPKLWLKV